MAATNDIAQWGAVNPAIIGATGADKEADVKDSTEAFVRSFVKLYADAETVTFSYRSEVEGRAYFDALAAGKFPKLQTLVIDDAGATVNIDDAGATENICLDSLPDISPKVLSGLKVLKMRGMLGYLDYRMFQSAVSEASSLEEIHIILPPAHSTWSGHAVLPGDLSALTNVVSVVLSVPSVYGTADFLYRDLCMNAERLAISLTAPDGMPHLQENLPEIDGLITESRLGLAIVGSSLDDVLLEITRTNAQDLQRLWLIRGGNEDAQLARILRRVAETDLHALAIDWTGVQHESVEWTEDQYTAFALSPNHKIAELSLTLSGFSGAEQVMRDCLYVVRELGKHKTLQSLTLCDVRYDQLTIVLTTAITSCLQVTTLVVCPDLGFATVVDLSQLDAALSQVLTARPRTQLANLLLRKPASSWDAYAQFKAVTDPNNKWDQSVRFTDVKGSCLFERVVMLMRRGDLVFDCLQTSADVKRTWAKVTTRCGKHPTELPVENTQTLERRWLWAGASLIAAFGRANLGHPFAPSILALVPQIVRCVQECDLALCLPIGRAKSPTIRSATWKKSDAFMGTRYVANVSRAVAAPAATAIVTAAALPAAAAPCQNGRKRKDR